MRGWSGPSRRPSARIAIARSRSPASEAGIAACQYSNGETGSPAPGRPPITTTVVAGAVATAWRCAPGGTKTSVPAGASMRSPSTVKAARCHHVELLVAAGARAALVVGLDEVVAGAVGRVGVDAQGRDPERPPDRPPRSVGERHALEVVAVQGPRRRHAPRR